jgi:hypothetical protein
MRFSARMCSALLAVFLFGPLWAGEADLDRAERLFREGEFRRAASLAARLVRRRATDAGSARAQALFVAASRAAGRAGNSDRFLRVAASRSAGADYFHALGSQLARLNEREAAERMLNRAL